MTKLSNISIAAVVIATAMFGSALAFADEDFSQKQLDFFENKVRPLLVNHCLECHSADNNESELRLDSRSSILKGGSSGRPGAIPANPRDSLIMQAVRHLGDYDMPPSKKLSDEEIADLASWVEMGMPWPEKSAAINRLSMAELMAQHQQKHWAFQPLVFSASTNKSNSKSRIDELILEQLDAHDLSQSPRADRRTLVRRAYFDLIGLPPTYQQVQSFVNDDDPNAYPKLIDQLLASPQYGERWARHWLDVARYSDTSGYTLDNADRNYPFAFTYRDYVIDAFNNDLPYDQFIREQLAADHLEPTDDNRNLAALGFISVGRKYLRREDTIDDQIDVVSRGLMGLTVACARCHDHKYDAIPTADYYSLYSVFENNYVPSELPLLGEPEKLKQFAPYFEELDTLQHKVESYRDARYIDLRKHLEENLVDYFARVVAPDQVEQGLPFIDLTDTQVRPLLLNKWRIYLANRATIQKPIMLPATELLKLPEDAFAENAKRMIDHWHDKRGSDDLVINPIVLAALHADPPKSKIDVGKIYGQIFQRMIDRWKSDGSKQPVIDQFKKGPEKQLANAVFSASSPISIQRKDLDRFLRLPEQKELKKLRSAVNELNTDCPDGIARAMVVRDKETIQEHRTMIRGNIHNRGEIVPRQFVALLSPNKRLKFTRKSGRLELAEKIASPDNPLTARVLVNRVWMHHFSTPLVDTPSDFGIRCEVPIQQTVLDYLAGDFMANGWSIKSLHRKIMLSDTYCQSSQPRVTCEKVDPENRLYWKMNRRRLEFEPLRDSILAVSRTLDKKSHGKPVDLLKYPFTKRRTIYGKVDRQDLPGLFRVFDLASPDQSAAKRTRTTVPQQSLFMMNSRFVAEQTRALVRSTPNFKNATRKFRVTALYRAVLQRDPSPKEYQLASEFISKATADRNSRIADEKEKETKNGTRVSESPETKKARLEKENRRLIPWQQFAQILLWSNEFEFID